MRKISALILSAIMLMFAGCGEDTAPPPTDFSQYVPQELSALSRSGSSVGLQWKLPSGVNDAILTGYLISYPGKKDTVGKRTTQYTALSLPLGATAFSISSLGASGAVFSGLTITWAPAERFDSGYVLTEYDVSHLTENSGLDCGTKLTDPHPVPVALAAQHSMDIYVIGQSGQSLRLRSAHLYLAAWNVTLMSSVTDSSTSLDVYKQSFPAEGTFGVSEVTVQDNRIYYLSIVGDNAGERNYVRLHVQMLGGTFPNRQILLRVSLQRLPGVPFAYGDRPDADRRLFHPPSEAA